MQMQKWDRDLSRGLIGSFFLLRSLALASPLSVATHLGLDAALTALTPLVNKCFELIEADDSVRFRFFLFFVSLTRNFRIGRSEELASRSSHFRRCQ
jgi:hypothetical protein